MPIASGVFHCAVTSPPYYGLRAYEGDQVVEWPAVTFRPMVGTPEVSIAGCQMDCEHEWGDKIPIVKRHAAHHTDDSLTGIATEKATPASKREGMYHGQFCAKCEGWKGALGAEPSLEMYIGHMVLVCREVERTMRQDGVFWLNISDSYNGSGGAGGDYSAGGIREGQPRYPGRNVANIQNGDMFMAPARLALALQADGWIIRKDNIWAKNAMPEPLKGWRWEHSACNCVKKQREAHIAEQMKAQGIDRHRIYDKAGVKFSPLPDCPSCSGTGRKAEIGIRKGSWRHTSSHEYVFQLTRQMQYYSDHTRAATSTGANPRDVMRPSRTNYSGKHFAVFPPHLIAPLLQSSTPKTCCSKCGTPWAPMIERGKLIQKGGSAKPGRAKESVGLSGPLENRYADGSSASQYSREWEQFETIVNGYKPTCEHEDAPPVPGLVLDPFMGSGTTGMVAREFGVNFVGLDISYQYLDEQATLRTQTGEPSKALDGLPLFNLEENDG